MRRLLTSLAVLFCICAVNADDLKWLTRDYDFGTFREVGGPKTGIVRFVNMGDSAVVINKVRPSCGCTGADFQKGLIAPGDTAWVSFTYNPAGRPGRFEKTVKVYTGRHNDLTTIKIRGTVIGEPTTLRSQYPYEAGPLRLASDRIDLGKVRYGSGRHEFVSGYNQSEDTIRPVISGLPKALNMMASSQAVAPGDMVTFSFYYDTKEEPELGRHEYQIGVLPSVYSDTLLSLSVTVDIEPDFSRLSAAGEASAPRVNLAPDPVEMGELKRGSKASFKFEISNCGKETMHVNRIYSASGAVEVKSYPVKIKPGKSGTVSGRVLTDRIPEDAFGLIVEVITDDPLHPVAKIRLAGRIY